MKVSLLLAAILIALTCFAYVQCATPVPLFLWSGKHYQYFKGKNAVCNGQKNILDKILKGILRQEKSKYLKGLNDKPEAMVFFVHEALGSDDFMRFAGSFGSQQKNSFSNLRSAVSSAALSFPSCNVKRGDKIANSIYATLSHFPEVAVHYVYETAKSHSSIAHFVNQLNAGKNVMTKGKINVFIVMFDEVSASHETAFAAHDATMHTITNKISELTGGNYVAGFTATHGADDKESTNVETLATASSDFVVFNTVSLKQSSSNSTNSTNSTTTAELYIDETIVGATLIMFIMFVLVVAAFYVLSDIKTGPHIADLLQGEEPTKKQR